MVTCRQLMELDVFHNIKLKAGRKGLDKTVSWIYAKHTKSIIPWVHGGEFILVSGYEYGTDESELLQLIEEAAMNDSSGILVEGGINFKEIPQLVIDKANEEEIPLFFAKGVVSFLEITRDGCELITENTYLTRKNISLLDQLLNPSLTQKDINQLLYSTGISPESCFLTAVFNISYTDPQLNRRTNERADKMVRFSRKLQKHMTAFYEQFGLKEIHKVNLDSIDYLIYADNLEELFEMAGRLEGVNTDINWAGDDENVYLSFGSVMQDSMDILKSFHEAYFTGELLRKGVFSQRAKSFSDIGSYQFLFFAEDHKPLIAFRDRHLKKLYEADLEGSSQLLHTLREFLNQSGNILQTSKNLFVHRNTLQYRIQKIETLTDSDLTIFQVRRDFANAFMILDVFPFA